MRLQLFTPLVPSSTLRDMVGRGFFRSASFVLSAADKEISSGFSSLAPRTNGLIEIQFGGYRLWRKARSKHTE